MFEQSRIFNSLSTQKSSNNEHRQTKALRIRGSKSSDHLSESDSETTLALNNFFDSVKLPKYQRSASISKVFNRNLKLSSSSNRCKENIYNKIQLLLVCFICRTLFTGIILNRSCSIRLSYRRLSADYPRQRLSTPLEDSGIYYSAMLCRFLLGDVVIFRKCPLACAAL